MLRRPLALRRRRGTSRLNASETPRPAPQARDLKTQRFGDPSSCAAGAGPQDSIRTEPQSAQNRPLVLNSGTAVPADVTQCSRMTHLWHVYILSSSSRCLYVGVTRNLQRRWLEHRANRGSEFCAKYRVRHLVYVESCDRAMDAFAREKQLKRWRREQKVAMIVAANPGWQDLAVSWGWHRIVES